MALATSLVMLFYCCATADILMKLLQQIASCFSLLWLYLGNSQVSVYRTIGPTLVLLHFSFQGYSGECHASSSQKYAFHLKIGRTD